MATAGTYNWNPTAEQIAIEALRKVRAIKPGEDPTNLSRGTIDRCLTALNVIIKGWINDGLHLWSVEQGIVLLTKNKRIYRLGDLYTDAADHDMFVLEFNDIVATAASASDTTITITRDSTDVPASGRVEITLDNGDIFHDTYTGVAANGTHTDLTVSAIPSVATSGNTVKIYAQDNTIIPRRIVSAQYREAEDKTSYIRLDGQSWPLEVVGREEYHRYSNKSEKGTVTSIYLDYNLKVSNLFTYPAPDGALTGIIDFYFERPLENFDTRTNNPDLPQEYMRALIDDLAYYLAPEYNVGMEERIMLLRDKQRSKKEALEYDQEYAPMSFTLEPEWRR